MFIVFSLRNGLVVDGASFVADNTILVLLLFYNRRSFLPNAFARYLFKRTILSSQASCIPTFGEPLMFEGFKQLLKILILSHGRSFTLFILFGIQHIFKK